jgi:hypothetical protein
MQPAPRSRVQSHPRGQRRSPRGQARAIHLAVAPHLRPALRQSRKCADLRNIGSVDWSKARRLVSGEVHWRAAARHHGPNLLTRRRGKTNARSEGPTSKYSASACGTSSSTTDINANSPGKNSTKSSRHRGDPKFGDVPESEPDVAIRSEIEAEEPVWETSAPHAEPRTANIITTVNPPRYLVFCRNTGRTSRRRRTCWSTNSALRAGTDRGGARHIARID